MAHKISLPDINVSVYDCHSLEWDHLPTLETQKQITLFRSMGSFGPGAVHTREDF